VIEFKLGNRVDLSSTLTIHFLLLNVHHKLICQEKDQMPKAIPGRSIFKNWIRLYVF